MAADWTTVKRRLVEAKRYRISVLCACEALVEQLAEEGNEEAAALLPLIVDSQRANTTALLEARLQLPAAPERTTR